ncbi:MAG: 3-deoxy-7-phosphoheptulonate synthase [Candidatus Cloacimonetes bacterium]|nr:3-deoxy-7-phosphoheptulonate synthase [Candidatus Cloacimonadota bacterium]
MIENERAVINVKGHLIGGDWFTTIAGPCTIENYKDLFQVASYLKKLGIRMFRGGAYKMRTSPHSFQGLGEEGLQIIHRVAEELEMVSVSEVVSVEDVELMAEHIDILQVGTRNMHNYRLLKKLGSIDKPVILKRGMCSTYDEWLLAAEHIKAAGNDRIILCERGIRTFDNNHTRNTLDISAVSTCQQLCPYPVIIDPSHSGGRRSLVRSLSWAAAAAGADGIILETHFQPDTTICDSQQTIDFDELNTIISKLPQLAALWNKKIQRYE